MNWKKAVRPVIRDTEALHYVHSGEGVVPEVDCSLGSCPFGSPQRVLDKWRTGFVSDPCGYMGDYTAVEQAIVDFWGGVVKKDEILHGAGSIGILYNLATLLGDGDFHVLGLAPQFPDVPLYFSYMESPVDKVLLSPPSYRFRVEDLISGITDKTAMVYLDNPHNPTGQAIPLSDVEILADHCLDRGIMLIVDEAYGGFMEEGESSINLKHSNLVCVRSFSKSWGMASLRAGYAIVRDPELRELYNKVCPPFPLSPDLLELIPLAMDEKGYLSGLRTRVAYLKKRTMDVILSSPGFSVAETSLSVPIMLVTSEDPEVDLFQLLLDVGIKSEPGEGFESLGRNSIRLRIPSPDKLEAFNTCWKELLKRL